MNISETVSIKAAEVSIERLNKNWWNKTLINR